MCPHKDARACVFHFCVQMPHRLGGAVGCGVSEHATHKSWTNGARDSQVRANSNAHARVSSQHDVDAENANRLVCGPKQMVSDDIRENSSAAWVRVCDDVVCVHLCVCVSMLVVYVRTSAVGLLDTRLKVRPLHVNPSIHLPVFSCTAGNGQGGRLDHDSRAVARRPVLHHARLGLPQHLRHCADG